MRKLKGKMKAFLLLAACLVFMISAVPVSAEIDENTKTNLQTSVESFLEQVYTIDDSQLEMLKENGGVYSVIYDAWVGKDEAKGDREIVGAFQSVESTVVNDEDPDEVVVTSDVKFANYDAEVILYFDGTGTTPKNYVMNIQYSLAEKMAQAAQNMAVGLIVVFAVLIFLTLVISLFRFIGPKKNNQAKKAQSDSKVAAPVKAQNVSAPKAAPAAAAVSTGSDDNEIAAVIAAAIAAALEEAPSASGYVVRSIRKVRTGSWKRV